MPPNPMIVAHKDHDSAEAKGTAEPLDLGVRIRELRTERGWSLDEAASQTGLSRSSLYKIEKDKMSPTFDALRKLAEGFGIGIQQLLVAPGDRRAASRRCITRRDDKPRYETKNYVYLPLAEDLAHKAILPFEIIVRARSLDDYDDWDRHDTEDFVRVLSGTLVVYTEFYEPVTLHAGDSIYYDGRMGHACVSEGETDAVALWVSST